MYVHNNMHKYSTGSTVGGGFDDRAGSNPPKRGASADCQDLSLEVPESAMREESRVTAEVTILRTAADYAEFAFKRPSDLTLRGPLALGVR